MQMTYHERHVAMQPRESSKRWNIKLRCRTTIRIHISRSTTTALRKYHDRKRAGCCK